MKNVLLSALAVVGLSGCVTAIPIITPTGQQGYTIDCSSTADIGLCYKKAGSLCGLMGYEIFDQTNHQPGFWTAANRTMVVRCRLPGEVPGVPAQTAQMPQVHIHNHLAPAVPAVPAVPAAASAPTTGHMEGGSVRSGQAEHNATGWWNQMRASSSAGDNRPSSE